MKKLLLTIGFLLLFPSVGFCASRYWVAGGDGNWNNTNNWSASSGGASGASVPGTADAVLLDGSSGAGTSTVNVAGDILSIDCTGFTGTLTQGANLTVSGSITLVAGMTFTPSTYVVTIDAASTLTSGGKEFYGLTIATASTITLADNATINNTFTTWITDNVAINGSKIFAKGDIAFLSPYRVTGTTTIEVSGGATQQWTSESGVGGTTYYFTNPVIINKSGNTMTVVGSSTNLFNASGNWTYTAGLIDFTTNTTTFVARDSQTHDLAGMTLYNLEFTGNAITTISSTTLVSNDFDISSVGERTLNTGTIQVSGSLSHTNANAGTRGNGTIELIGTTSETFSYGSTQGLRCNVTINRTGGTLTLSGTITFGETYGAAYGGSTFTYTQGTVAAGTSVIKVQADSTLDTDGMSFYDITADAGTLTLASDLDLSRNYILSGSTLAGNFTTTIGGNLTSTSGTVSAGTISFSGATTHTIDGTETYVNLTCPSGENCSFDDADIFTVSGTGSGDGTWTSDDVTNTVDIDFTAETIASGAGTRVDSAGGVEVTTSGVITDCVNWSAPSTRRLLILT